MLYYVPNEFTMNHKHVSNSIITVPNISKCKSVLLEIYFIETETEIYFDYGFGRDILFR